MRADELIERARSAMAVPTLYWIGAGTTVTDPDDPRGPAQEIDVQAELARMPQAQRLRYLAAAAQAGATLPPAGLRVPACDCAAYVRWALRLPAAFAQAGPGTHWMNTTAMHADALGPQRLFTLDGTGSPQQARPGALLVYPKPPPGWRNARGEAEDYGHVGIVATVDGGARGPVRTVLHCAPENWLAAVPPGGERNGIAETTTTRFDEHAAIPGHETIAVWCRQVAG